MKIKLGTKERQLNCSMKNIKAIEDNLNHGVIYISRKVLVMDLKQSDYAKIFSAGLLGSQDFLEADEVEKLMYSTEGVTPLYYANIAVDYMEKLFTIPDELKKKADEPTK